MAVWAPITGFWATLGWFFGQISFKHFSYNLFQTGLLRHSNCLSFLVRLTANLLPIKIILKRKKCYFEIVCQLWGLASNPSTIFCCCCCCVCRERIWQFFSDYNGSRRIVSKDNHPTKTCRNFLTPFLKKKKQVLKTSGRSGGRGLEGASREEQLNAFGQHWWINVFFDEHQKWPNEDKLKIYPAKVFQMSLRKRRRSSF